jgi:hypothetical protein
MISFMTERAEALPERIAGASAAIFEANDLDHRNPVSRVSA